MTRYPRQVDREYLSCPSGGFNKIQMIDGGTLDLHQDLVACDRRRRYIVEHQLPTIFQQSDRFHASSPRVCPVGATRAGRGSVREHTLELVATGPCNCRSDEEEHERYSR